MNNLKLVIDRKVGRHTIAPVMKKEIITRRQGRLHIYIRDEMYKGKLRCKNYVGRCYLNGVRKIKSSGTANKRQAIKILDEWYMKLNYAVEMGIDIRVSTFGECLKRYLKEIDNDKTRSDETIASLKRKFNIISKCQILMKQDINKVDVKFITSQYLTWRMERAKLQKKVLRGATLRQDLVGISGFLNWCYKEGYKLRKVEGISTQCLSRELKSQSTTRTQFSLEDYKLLKEKSLERIESAESSKVRFAREKLHHFIIFMFGSGLRVYEATSLTWNDIDFMDRTTNVAHLRKTNNRTVLDSKYLIVRVKKSKHMKYRETFTLSSSYYALKRLRKLYIDNEIDFNNTDTIFMQKSFRDGMRELLIACNLRYSKDDSFLKRDSKSFRHSFIQTMLDRGLSYHEVSQLCGTSERMIGNFYTAHQDKTRLLDKMNDELSNDTNISLD